MSRLTHIKKDIDMSDWELDAIDEAVEHYKEAVRKGLAESFKYVFESPNTYIFFPVEWYDEDSAESSDGIGNVEVDDPLTVYLRLSFQEDGPVTYSFNLRAALELTLTWCRADGSHSMGLRKLSTAFRKLTDDIDEVIAEGERKCPR